MSEIVYTENKGKLETLPGFEFIRGESNKGKVMGKAKDEEGNTYRIVVASCEIPHCYCAAKAIGL